MRAAWDVCQVNGGGDGRVVVAGGGARCRVDSVWRALIWFVVGVLLGGASTVVLAQVGSPADYTVPASVRWEVSNMPVCPGLFMTAPLAGICVGSNAPDTPPYFFDDRPGVSYRLVSGVEVVTGGFDSYSQLVAQRPEYYVSKNNPTEWRTRANIFRRFVCGGGEQPIERAGTPAGSLWCKPVNCPPPRVWSDEAQSCLCPIAPGFSEGDYDSVCELLCKPLDVTLRGVSGPGTYCDFRNLGGYCEVASSICVRQQDGSKLCYASRSGRKCDPSNYASDHQTNSESDEKPKDDEADCVKRGMSLGTVNGVTTCLPRGTPGANPTESEGETTTTRTEPDGSKTETRTRTQVTTNTDGTITVVRTTETTTNKGEANEDTKTETEGTTGTRAEICAAMPELAACRSDGKGTGGGASGDGDGGGGDASFGGSCEAQFTCEGDAVQCAIALEQHKRNCQMWESNSLSELGKSILEGADPRATELPGPDGVKEEYDMSARLQVGEAPGACISDQTFELPFGKSLTVPWSLFCGALDFAGLVVLLIALVVALRIVFS